jgi:glutathione peroxidase
LAFPCNQFNNDSKTNAEIKQELKQKHGVRFPMMDKVHVNGSSTHDVFKYLKGNTKELRDREDPSKVTNVPWNFCRWIVDMDGKVHMFLNPTEGLDRCNQLIDFLCDNEPI